MAFSRIYLPNLESEGPINVVRSADSTELGVNDTSEYIDAVRMKNYQTLTYTCSGKGTGNLTITVKESGKADSVHTIALDAGTRRRVKLTVRLSDDNVNYPFGANVVTNTADALEVEYNIDWASASASVIATADGDLEAGCFAQLEASENNMFSLIKNADSGDAKLELKQELV